MNKILAKLKIYYYFFQVLNEEQLMKIFFKHYFYFAVIAVTGVFLLGSCTKDENDFAVKLIDSSLKEIIINSGFSDEIIPIHSDDWSISYVKDTKSGELFKNSQGESLKLEDQGTVLLEGGWLTMAKTEDDELRITLLENFSDIARDFKIGILSGENREEIHFVQSRGDEYEIVGKVIEEIDGSRNIYRSDEGCTTIRLVNHSAQPMNMDVTEIYKGVQYMSDFSSDDYEAFGWVNNANSLVYMDDLKLDDHYFMLPPFEYKNGPSYVSFLDVNHSKEAFLIAPHTTKTVSGMIEYLERTCRYALTIRNKSSGNQFEITGLLKQKIPIGTITALID